MNKCMLCERKISNKEYSFGLGCLKKSCSIMNIDGIKNIAGEEKLNEIGSKILSK